MRSFNHALTLLTAGCLTAFFWCFLRLPDSNLLIVTNAFQLTSVLYDVPGWQDRFKLAMLSTSCAAILQFLIAMCMPGKFLLLIIPGIFMYLILAELKNRKCAATALIIGSLGIIAEPGFVPGLNRAFDMIYSLAAIMIATSLVGLVHVRSNYTTIFSGGFTKIQALRIACMMVLGMYILKTTRMPEGVWIMLTISMIYAGASPEQPGYTLAGHRIAATPIGLYFCFLFLSCITFFNASALYLFPLFGGLGFFLLFYTGNYLVFTMFFVMVFSIYADFSTGTYSPFHLGQVLMSRTIATAIGGGILIFFEAYFLPDRESSLMRGILSQPSATGKDVLLRH